jgi:rare lipoprotein A
MYAFSAAHKTLPLPSYARVTNLANGKSVVVRVNDRGPFHAGRIIDLSYAAAVKLGVHRAGVAKVEVRALRGPDDAAGTPILAAAPPAKAAPATPGAPAGASSVTLQVASYSTREHAERGLARLRAAGIGAARLLEPLGQRFWRLRVGPLDLKAAEALALRVAELGFGPPQRLRD